MKYIIIILLCALFISCTVNYEKYDFDDNINPATMHDAYLYAVHIKYKKDYGNVWQTPEVTYRLRTGDCEDKAILMAYLWEKYFDIESELVILWSGWGWHVAVKYNSKWYDPAMYYYESDVWDGAEVKAVYTYDEAIQRAIRDSNGIR